MSNSSSIEWTDATWNPIRGCTRVSPGCELCYAENMAARFSGRGQWGETFATMKSGKPRWTGNVALIEEKLDEPLQWKKPRRIFVNSTSDLFHEKLSDKDIDRVFVRMADCRQHTFQILTKRGDRMRRYMLEIKNSRAIMPGAFPWPLPNVWLGVSVENQQYANERIPHLLETPAALRFVSYEPALGPVDFTSLCNGHYFFDALAGRKYHDDPDFGAHAKTPPIYNRLGWIIVGGESGPRARPFALEWARSTIRQCKGAGVPVFVKQLGANPASIRLNAAKGNYMKDWPEDLRVRQFPEQGV